MQPKHIFQNHTHRKNEDGTRTYHYYIDGKLYAKGVLIGDEFKKELVA